MTCSNTEKRELLCFHLIMDNHLTTRQQSLFADLTARILGSSCASRDFAATDYAEMALVAPRLAVAEIFPPGRQTLEGFHWWREVGEQQEKNRGTWLARADYSSAGLGPENPNFKDAPIISPVEGYSVVRHGEALPSWVHLSGDRLGVIEEAYLPAIKSLCDRNNAILLLLRQPMFFADEQAGVTIPAAFLSLGIPILVAPLKGLFADSNNDVVKMYYYNGSHLNANGARQNSFSLTPVLMAFVTGSAR